MAFPSNEKNKIYKSLQIISRRIHNNMTKLNLHLEKVCIFYDNVESYIKSLKRNQYQTKLREAGDIFHLFLGRNKKN